ncbi:hypothetical protein LMH87_002149 [Akanthomyces muscarius]|uniref:Mating-type switching protein swi10 n=1 Tax=Akanthomyces muscarius TaxID=2231603 RepID=A0A9W8UJD1_AKAMU|nr:hypothetical protein LMH87_002149 [Akanthomyces muscarius]KAJ4147638.1 hypothetical protein LMH87_002149 [Akanthomyces muscarius]
MPQRQRLSLYIPGSPPGALPESTYTPTPTSDRRRSLISLTESLSLGNLKPSRARLQKYWPGAKSPTTTTKATTTTHDLSALIMLAGEQMGALADPRRRRPASSSRPAPCQQDDPQLWQDLEMSLPKSATALSRHSSGSGSIQRKPLPTNAAPRYYPSPAAVPAAPSRAPPPPPIPELSAVNFHSEDVKLAESPPPPVMPLSPVFPSTVRRRAKTPVHHIGQLEAAQRNRNKPLHYNGNMDGVNRMSSVSTIAREYRELAVHSDMDIPDVPKIDASYLLQQGIIELPATNSQEGHLLGASYHHHQRTPSSTSDDGMLLGSEPDTCPSLTHSSSPPAEMSDAEDGDEPPALASLRFQIGLELLTKELSTAFADQSSRRPKDGTNSAGLQIWVMIEAYERLREQLDANKPTEENVQARDAIDSWIRALYAIHNNIASEGAGDDSEYENDQ